MNEWADVWVSSYQERTALEKKALFFVLGAFERLHSNGISQTDLVAESRIIARSATSVRDLGAGRSAIEHILKCWPVSYQSAIRFLYTANALLAQRNIDWRFNSRDIIACVFRLKDAPDIAKILNVSPHDISSRTGISLPIVVWAMQRWRISYNHANSIWMYLLDLKSRSGSSDEKLSVITNDIADLVRTDVRSDLPLGIKSIVSEDHNEYVYRWDDLSPAPQTGHKWAVDT